MTTTIDLNADLGEMPDSRPRDIAILNIVTSCNIACGGHAGDRESMSAMLAAAKERGVAAGAHPSYPDREHFGRRSLDIAPDVLAHSLQEQIAAFVAAAAAVGVPVHHIKPHGALYNDMADHAELAGHVAEICAAALPGAPLVGLADSQVEAAARRAGLPFIAEAFVDRRYTDAARLVPRDRDGAVIADPAARAAQAERRPLHGADLLQRLHRLARRAGRRQRPLRGAGQRGQQQGEG